MENQDNSENIIEEGVVEEMPARLSRFSLKERLEGVRLSYVIIASLICILTALLIFGQLGKKRETQKLAEMPPAALEVVSVELVGFDRVRILFNDEIDEHVLEHSLAVTPSNNGQIIMGESAREYFFQNSEYFPLASSILIEVNQGLESKSHLTLLAPQVFWLQTSLDKSQVTFEKDGMYAKVMPAIEGTPLKFIVQSGSSVKGPTINVYKSTQSNLLDYLTYTIPESKIQKDGTFSSYDVEFKSYYIEHDESLLVSSFEAKGSTEQNELHLEKGIYYLEAVKNGQRVGSSYVIVSSKGIVFRQDDKKSVIAAFDAKSGAKIEDSVQIAFYNLKDAPVLREQKVFQGITTIDTPFEDKTDLLIATIGDEKMLIPLKIKDSLADLRVNKDLDLDTQMFLYTDRPIYKPGDTVFFRGTVRVDSDALYKLPQGGMKVHVWMNSYNDSKVYNEIVAVDANGLFSGNFILSKESVGDYQGLYVSLAGLDENEVDYDNYSYAYFDVQEYKKPKFELTTTKDKDEYYRNEKIGLKIKGSFFNSKPLSGEKVDYKVYATTYYEQEKKVYNQNFNVSQQGGMCGGGGFGGDYYGEEVTGGQVELDDKGMGDISISLGDTKLPKNSQMLTVVVSKNDDESGNVIQSAIKTIVHAGLYNIFFIPSPSEYKTGEEIIVPFYVESSVSDGTLPKEVRYEFRTDNWNTDGFEGKEELSGKVEIDGNGKGVVKFSSSKITSGYTYLTILAEDSYDNVSESQKYVYITKETQEYQNNWYGNNDSQTYFKIVSDSNSYIVGDTIRLNIISPKDLDVLLAPERGRIYEPRVIHLNKGENKIEIPVTNDLSPSITLTFSFFADGKYYSEGVPLNVPSMHKLLQVEIRPDKDSYKPNEIAMLTIVTKNFKGDKIPAQFSLGVVDEAIYGLRRDATPLIHTSFYYFRPRSTNASSSLTMIGSFNDGGRGGGGGGGSNNKLVDTLFWAPVLSTGENGELVVPVKLNNVKTVWRVQAIASDSFTNLGQSLLRVQVK